MLLVQFSIADTIILVDPDGIEIIVETTGPIQSQYGLGQELSIVASVDTHLAPVSFSQPLQATAFSPGYPLLHLDDQSHVATLQSIFQGLLNISSPDAGLNCQSTSGIPVYPHSGISATVDSEIVGLRQYGPEGVALLSPLPDGGVQVHAYSIFDDLSCGPLFVNLLFSDGLEVASP